MDFDVRLFHWINGFIGSPTFDQIVDHLSDDVLVRCIVFIAPLWWFWFQPHPDLHQRRQTVFSLVLATFIALLANRGMAALLPFRPRPFIGLPDFHVKAVADVMTMERWSSFPSDHATFFFALATGLFLLSRWLGVVAMIVAGAVICLPRIYVGIHYPSDVVVGALLGIAAVWLLRNLARWPVMSFNQIERWSHRNSGWWHIGFFLIAFEMAQLFEHARALIRAVPRLLAVYGVALRPEAGLFVIAGCLAVVTGVALLWRRWRLAAATSKR